MHECTGLPAHPEASYNRELKNEISDFMKAVPCTRPVAVQPSLRVQNLERGIWTAHPAIKNPSRSQLHTGHGLSAKHRFAQKDCAGGINTDCSTSVSNLRTHRCTNSLTGGGARDSSPDSRYVRQKRICSSPLRPLGCMYAQA